MSPDTTDLSPGARIGLGLLMAALGCFPMLAAFDVGPLGPADINGPPWMGFVAGAIFAVGGLMVAAGERLKDHPLGFLLLVVLLGGFAAIGNWIAFGAGTRACNVSISGFSAFPRDASDLACRGAFGMGALILNGMLIVVLAQGLVRVTGPGPIASRIQRMGEWVVLLALLPILIPLVFFTLLKALFEAARDYFETGRWPRNEAFIKRMKDRRPGGRKV
jgi:hypothetical protein